MMESGAAVPSAKRSIHPLVLSDFRKIIFENTNFRKNKCGVGSPWQVDRKATTDSKLKLLPENNGREQSKRGDVSNTLVTVWLPPFAVQPSIFKANFGYQFQNSETFACRLSFKTSATECEKTRRASSMKFQILVVLSELQCHIFFLVRKINLKIQNRPKSTSKTSK